nr:immunoglobulin heavy chain junction region [Mus musculus]
CANYGSSYKYFDVW